ncbi:MAG: hypothetical protein AB7P69_13620 [Candidatus Binatia bacterium]
MTHKDQSQTPIGRQVLEEAAQLLRQLRFSERRGAYAEGQYVAVSADPRWNADEETIQVLVTCYPFGHRRADWAMLPIRVQSDSGTSGVHALARLDTRGQARIPRLPPGEYRLSLRLKPMQATPVLSRQLERLAAQEQEEEETERQVWRGTGENNTVAWTLEETEDGEVQISFETSDERLADSAIVFHLIDPTSKQTRYSRQLTLQPTRTPGKWEAWCSIGSHAEFPGPYELVFEVGAMEETET